MIHDDLFNLCAFVGLVIFVIGFGIGCEWSKPCDSCKRYIIIGADEHREWWRCEKCGANHGFLKGERPL